MIFMFYIKTPSINCMTNSTEILCKLPNNLVQFYKSIFHWSHLDIRMYILPNHPHIAQHMVRSKEGWDILIDHNYLCYKKQKSGSIWTLISCYTVVQYLCRKRITLFNKVGFVKSFKKRSMLLFRGTKVNRRHYFSLNINNFCWNLFSF